MKACEWIVCERSGRWAAALRIAMAGQTSPLFGVRQLREVRSLEELTRTLEERRCALAFIEVRRANIGEALKWMADADLAYPGARCLALLDNEELDCAAQERIMDALRAAGAVEIAHSPRHLQPLLAIARRHAASQLSTPTDVGQPFAEWAWSLLPWQSA
jgi:hypothetical protein